MTDYEEVDKHWAKRYILDPLTAPEPSQETGPGSSHYNVHLRASQPRSPPPASPTPRRARPNTKTSSIGDRTPSASSDGAIDPFADSKTSASYINNHSPPQSPGFYKVSASASPPPYSHISNPYGTVHRSRHTAQLGTYPEKSTGLASPPHSPKGFLPVPDGLAASHSGRIPIRSASARTPGPPRLSPPQQHQRHQQHARSRSDGHDQYRTAATAPAHNYRHSSLPQRHPGDMSHRPLDMITRDTRAADRRHRKRFSDADTIDLLDNVGPTYHHGGPYDATLVSRNLDKKYSPVEAVRDSNLAALRATPREFIMDSLVHHRPLQGTSTIPSGFADANGNVMNYEEGADLMREPDAAGGAYKRYDFIDYHPDDLKGKGEPSFTIERAIKAGKGKGRPDISIEMETNPIMAKSMRRRKSVPASYASGSSAKTASHLTVEADQDEEQHLGRQNSTGRRISEGLKRRFGSLRRKKSTSPEA